METVLSLVVIGVIYSVVFVVKSLLAKNPGVDAKPVMTEVFPEIKACEMPFLQEDMQPRKKEKKAIRTVSKEKPHEVVEEPVVEEKKEHRRISLGGKSEAKRAFIYSEIFNRKY